MEEDSRSPFPLRGVIEGFYGTFYTFPQRNDLIRFLGEHDFNLYLYGPKNDRQHRSRWWDPYPPEVMAEFAHTIDLARQHGIAFAYAISFGTPLTYASDQDLAVITAKFQAFYDRGCRDFAVLLDDLPNIFVPGSHGFRSAAEVHADCCNRLYDWIISHDPACTLNLCAPEYHGRPPFSEYLHTLGQGLHAGIGVFYTGPEVASHQIDVPSVQAYGAIVGRQPLIWDNYPVNDLQMRGELHLGPLRGRDPRLPEVCTGFLSNLALQPEASKLPLLTVAEYTHHPANYDPDSAWERALASLKEPSLIAAVRLLAENSASSPVDEAAMPRLDALILPLLAQMRAGKDITDRRAVGELREYLTTLDEAMYACKNRTSNLALRQELLPWVEAIEEKLWLARFTLQVLTELAAGQAVNSQLDRLDELLAEVRSSTPRIGGQAVLDLAEAARRLARQGEGTVADISAASGSGA